MTIWIVAIWFGLLAAWLAYVLYDDAKATFENLRKWHRTPGQGPWGHHIHAVDLTDKDES